MNTIIFDIDGTLLDTTEYIYQAFEQSLEKHGFPALDREEMSHRIGESLADCYKAFSGASDVEYLMDAHHAFQLGHSHLPIAYEGALDTLEALKKRGFHIGALTSRSAATVHDTLADAGLDEYIEYV